MQLVQPITATHDGVIHDVAYDFFGKRMASCSSDHKIKIWDKDEKNGEWVCSAEWKAHQSPVWKIDWAHPEYGQLIASCSFDRTVVIWEDKGRRALNVRNSNSNSNNNNDSLGGMKNNNGLNTHFALKVSLMDFKQAVNDIAFSPRHVGLQLAAATDDGFVNVYEFTDVTDMAQRRVTKFEASKVGATAVAWSTARFTHPMLVVGANDGVVTIWGYSENFRRWQRLFNLTINGHTSCIHDVSWAPDIGRSNHVIATCSKDRTLRIWNVPKDSPDNNNETTTDNKNTAANAIATTTTNTATTASNTNTETDPKSRDIKAAQIMEDHESEVWRVQWNVTGTTLGSSGDDGTVKIWKQNTTNLGNGPRWILDGVIAGSN